MRIAKLPEKIKEIITVDRNFGIRHGIELLRLKDKPDKQLELAERFACMQEEGKPMLLDSGLKSTENHALEIGFEEGPGDPFFRSTCTSYEDPYDSCRRPLNRLLPDDNRHSFKLKKNNSSR